MKRTDILILGAGLSGLSAACHLTGRDYLVVERDQRPGGLCVSEHRDGFTFDRTGHWLHMKDDRVISLFHELFSENEYTTVERDTYIFSHDTFTRYPFQSNTYGLPPDIITECVVGFIRAHYENDKSRAGENFYEWCMAYLGEGISKHFMVPYNSKIYTVHPREFASHWCDRYIPVPTVEEVVEGSVTAPERKVGYNATFVYPQNGGIGALPRRLYDRCEQEKFMFGKSVVSVDPAAHIVTLSDGTEMQYGHLVSSIPLRSFLSGLNGSGTEEMRHIGAALSAASVSYLNVGFSDPPAHPGHWYYIPEKKFMPYRVGSFSNVHPALAPPGKGSAYIEYTHRNPLTEQQIRTFKKESASLLTAMGLVHSAAQISFMDYRCIDTGYVIFHDDYFSHMDAVNTYLARNDITPAGRYGKWTYAAMENAICDGMAVAEKLR